MNGFLAFTYHAVVVTRDDRLLTSYRINGGRTAFENDRSGIPLFVTY